MSRRNDGSFSFASLLILVCAVILVVGFFLPVLYVDGAGDADIKVSGLDLTKFIFGEEPEIGFADITNEDKIKEVAKWGAMESYQMENKTAMDILKWSVFVAGCLSVLVILLSLVTIFKPYFLTGFLRLLGGFAFVGAVAALVCVIVLTAGGSDWSSLFGATKKLGFGAIMFGAGGVGAFVLSLFKKREY